MGILINPYRFANPNTPPACISDGNTVAWYIADDLTTITKDGSNLVSQWNDKLGSGHDLLQADDGKKPTYSINGITLDGSNDYMKTSPFTFNNGLTAYIVLKVVNYQATNRYIVDGNSNGTFALYQNSETRLILYSITNDNFTTGDLHIIRAVENGGTNQSKFIIDNTTPALGSIYSNLGGITIGGKSDGTNPCNVLFRELLFRKVVDNSTNETAIYNYLATKYGFTTI